MSFYLIWIHLKDLSVSVSPQIVTLLLTWAFRHCHFLLLSDFLDQFIAWLCCRHCREHTAFMWKKKGNERFVSPKLQLYAWPVCFLGGAYIHVYIYINCSLCDVFNMSSFPLSREGAFMKKNPRTFGLCESEDGWHGIRRMSVSNLLANHIFIILSFQSPRCLSKAVNIWLCQWSCTMASRLDCFCVAQLPGVGTCD